jgi:hypothetical protein
MRGAITCLLVGAFVLGCNSATEPGHSKPAEPTSSPDTTRSPDTTLWGELMLIVNVSGDSTQFPTFFNAYLDGNLVGTVKPNDSLGSSATTGSHGVTIYATETEWCEGSNYTQLAYVLKHQVVTVAFNVDCPPLVGSGNIEVAIVATGNRIPDSFPVSLTRINGSPYSDSVDAAPNRSVEVTVTVGDYRIKVETRGCQWYAGFLFTTSQPVLRRAVLREGSAIRVTPHFFCN